MRRALIWSVCVMLAIVSGVSLSWNRSRAQEPQNIQTLMKLKLTHAQGILEGIALEDFDKIQKSAQGVSLVSQAAGWQIYQTPEYLRQSAEFRRTADDMARHAKEKNLDAAALDYVQMTMCCINCHKHVRGVKVTRGEPLPLPSFGD